jgi:hypothetical protein
MGGAFRLERARTDWQKSSVMNEKKIYSDASDRVTIVCDHCGKTKAVDVSSFKHIKRALKIRCACHHEFRVFVEVKRFHRKKTAFTGEYEIIKSTTPLFIKKDDILIEDLSRTGVGMRTKRHHKLKADDIDKQQTEIQRRAVIRNVKDDYIGAEFLNADGYDHANRLLGFYLMSR